MKFAKIMSALRLVNPLGLFAVIFSCATLTGYFLAIDPLYRPLSNGPATHPLTAVSIALLGLSVMGWRPYHPGRWPIVFSSCALLLGAARLLEVLSGIDLLTWLTPFHGFLASEKALGRPISIGSNTATMIVMLALAMLLTLRRKAFAAQVVTFLALAFPLLAVTGYAYGLQSFYGRMSLTTVFAALPVGYGILFAGANRYMMRAVLSPWIGGRIARVQITLGYLVPFLIGYALLGVIARYPDELFGVFVVLVSGFVSALVTFSAVIQERVDKKRRCAERRLKFVAMVDPLTGIPNRRMMMEHALREWERMRRKGSVLSVLMLDIDHFKRINDTCGHAVGDKALLQVAAVARAMLRGQDIVARFGGEEFVVILQDTDLDGARHLAEKLRLQIDRESIDDLASAGLSVTVSIGCATSREANDFNELLSLADVELYRAKSEGRNRVCCVEVDGGN